ncbi:MAG: CHAT domain-containing protein, partial [Saprospiraceae bacterium]|nr:CHAT domain-containing protein [Saprospiraceae bacterium]
SLMAEYWNDYGVLLIDMKDYTKSDSFLGKAIRILEVSGDSISGTMAAVKFNAGGANFSLKKYNRSEQLYLQVIELSKKGASVSQSIFTGAFNRLSQIYHLTSAFDKRRQILSDLRAYWKEKEGEGGKNYHHVTLLGGANLVSMRDFNQAEIILKEEMINSEKWFGTQSFEYGQCLYELGICYRHSGAHYLAEKMNLDALAIFERFGDKYLDYYTNTNTHLAFIYVNLGMLGPAEQYALKAKTLYDRHKNPNPLNVAAIAVALGDCYLASSKFEAAEAQYLKSLEIREKSLGTKHAEYAISVLKLASLYQSTGDYEKSRKYYLELLNIREQVFGKNHVDYFVALGYSARLDMLQNQPDSALYKFGKVLQFFRSNDQYKAHLSYLQTLVHQSTLEFWKKDFRASEATCDEALKIIESDPLKNWIQFQKVLMKKTLLAKIKSDKNWGKYAAQITDNLWKTVSGLSICQSDMEMSKSLLGIENYQSELLSWTLDSNRDPQMVSALYDISLSLKKIVQENRSTISDAIALTPDSIQAVYKSYLALNRQFLYNYLNQRVEAGSASRAQWQADSLEKILIRSVAGFSELRRRVTWKDVQQSLQSGEAAVEFVRFDYYDPNPTDSVMYAALVLRPGNQSPGFIPLFEKNDITPLLQFAGGGSINKVNRLYQFQESSQSQKNLYELIWKPLEPSLKGIKTVYCAPAGLLHRLNLAAIPVRQGELVSDRRHIVILGSTRQITAPAAAFPKQQTAYLAGGIQYHTDSISVTSQSSSRGLPESEGITFIADSTLRGDTWGYLPESAREVSEVSGLLWKNDYQTQLDTGFLATEASFKSLGYAAPSPRIIHLSTHGFFFPDPAVSPNTKRKDAEPVFKHATYPLIRTGLILAGGNHAWSGKPTPEGLEDGILTAYEISQMNLSQTELVVLSACETGLGDIRGNEGVYGLQRAFKIAGVKYLIMSLWKVNDQTTRELMTGFYRQWLEQKQTIPDAFAAAQAHMRTKYPGAPFHWAGFVLVE